MNQQKKSKFKTQLEKDIAHVFLNQTEFAESVILDGQAISAVLEDLEITADNSREGVSFEGKTIYAEASQLLYDYSPHKSCVLNNEKWFVLEKNIDAGLAVIKLYREKA